MKKKIRLTESEMVTLIETIVNEIKREKRKEITESTDDDRYYDKIINIIEKPYFKNLKSMGVSEEQWETIFSKLFGEPVNIDFSGTIRNNKGKVIYTETSEGDWTRKEYDNNGRTIYNENSKGFWGKLKYDSNGRLIYSGDSDGYWEKWKYSNNGRTINYENSLGITYIQENDEDGNQIYYENSQGRIEDDRDESDNYYHNILRTIEPPYFQNLEIMGVDDDNWYELFEKLFDKDIVFMNFPKNDTVFFDFNGEEKILYHEDSDGEWVKNEYDENGNLIYLEIDGGWEKYEYDDNGRLIFQENSLDGVVKDLRGLQR
jgi:YD repeat-containing protein